MFYPGVFINMFDSRGFLFPHAVSLYIDKCITRSKILVVVISNRRNLLLSLCISRYAYRNHKILNILFKILFQIIPFIFFSFAESYIYIPISPQKGTNYFVLIHLHVHVHTTKIYTTNCLPRVLVLHRTIICNIEICNTCKMSYWFSSDKLLLSICQFFFH